MYAHQQEEEEQEEEHLVEDIEGAESTTLLASQAAPQASFFRRGLIAAITVGVVAYAKVSGMKSESVEEKTGIFHFDAGSDSPFIELAGASVCFDSAVQTCINSTYVTMTPDVQADCDKGKQKYTALYDRITIYNRKYLCLLVTAKNYDAVSCDQNGYFNKFGNVWLDPGEQVTLLYQLVDCDEYSKGNVKEVTVDNFLMTWFGFSDCLDGLACDVRDAEGKDGGYVQIYTPADSNIGVNAANGCVRVRTNSGVAVDPPNDPLTLTPEQKQNTLTMSFKDTSRWTFTFTSRADTCPQQQILFSGMSNVMDCYQPALGDQGEDAQEYSTLSPFDCTSGQVDADPLQVIGYDDRYELKALQLSGPSAGTYTKICDMPLDGSTGIDGGIGAFSKLNACGINPKDNYAYCELYKQGADPDKGAYLVRIARDCEMELVAKMPPQQVVSGTFDQDGTFWTDKGKKLWSFQSVNTLLGYSDATSPPLADFSNSQAQNFGCLPDEFDVASVNADFDGDGVMSNYLIFIGNNAQELYVIDTTINPNECKSFPNVNLQVPSGTGNLGQFGAGWSYDGSVYFSSNTGKGVVQIDTDMIDWNNPSGTINVEWTSESEKTSQNDGLNCMNVEPPFPTNTQTTTQTQTTQTVTATTVTATETSTQTSTATATGTSTATATGTSTATVTETFTTATGTSTETVTGTFTTFSTTRTSTTTTIEPPELPAICNLFFPFSPPPNLGRRRGGGRRRFVVPISVGLGVGIPLVLGLGVGLGVGLNTTMTSTSMPIYHEWNDWEEWADRHSHLRRMREIP